MGSSPVAVTGVFLWILQDFQEHFFTEHFRTTASVYFNWVMGYLAIIYFYWLMVYLFWKKYFLLSQERTKLYISTEWLDSITAQKMNFFIKDFSSKCDQIGRKLRNWSHLLKKSLMKKFIFCAVYHVMICWTRISYLMIKVKCLIILAQDFKIFLLWDVSIFLSNWHYKNFCLETSRSCLLIIKSYKI